MWTREAIEESYRRHAASVTRRCRQLVRNDADAHDLAQEVFLSLLESPDAFRNRSSLGTYLFGVATFMCLKRLRNDRARGATWQSAVAEHWDTRRLPAADRALEARQILEHILSEADEKTARIAVFHFVDGLSQGDIGTLVGLSRVSVNQRLKSFRARLKTAIEEAA